MGYHEPKSRCLKNTWKWLIVSHRDQQAWIRIAQCQGHHWECSKEGMAPRRLCFHLLGHVNTRAQTSWWFSPLKHQEDWSQWPLTGHQLSSMTLLSSTCRPFMKTPLAGWDSSWELQFIFQLWVWNTMNSMTIYSRFWPMQITVLCNFFLCKQVYNNTSKT